MWYAARVRSLLLPAIVLGLAGWSHRADAFCRTSVCDPSKTTCPTVDGEPSCAAGQPLQWPLRCVGLSLHEVASRQVPYADFEKATHAAFDAWNNADCGGAPPSISVVFLGPIGCGKREFNQGKGNANIVLFREDSWPYQGSGSVLALTTITFGVTSGTIFDADLEINAASPGIVLTTSDESPKIDLQSILTHEAGHFLGMAHSLKQGATMFPSYAPGSLLFRDLSDDDVAGICAAYPPDRSAGACDPRAASTNSAGFSARCTGDDISLPPPSDGETDDGGCSCRSAGQPPGAGGLALAIAVAALRRARRRVT